MEFALSRVGRHYDVRDAKQTARRPVNLSDGREGIDTSCLRDVLSDHTQPHAFHCPDRICIVEEAVSS